MEFGIFTAGHRLNPDRRSYVSIEKTTENFFIPYKIKTVIDLRSASLFPTFNEKTGIAHPYNMPKYLSGHNINYYNFGDLLLACKASLSNLESRQERLTRWDATMTNILKLSQQIGSDSGDVCLFFSTAYNYMFKNNARGVMHRGLFCSTINRLFSDQEIKHYLPFTKQEKIITNAELFEDAYGELVSFYSDRREKAQEAYYENSHYQNNDDSGYSRQELDDMYRDAYDGNMELTWNND